MKTLLSTLKAPKEVLKEQIEKSATSKGKDCWLFVPEKTEGKVCLVAHIDTVWDTDVRRFGQFGSVLKKAEPKTTPREKTLLHDKQKGLIWSPDGLGADDRAGVYAALKLFHEAPEPYKPYVLLTDYEESGGAGAREAAELFATELAGCNFLIELDRANGNDAVFYNGEPDGFAKYIEEFGFKESHGSFSDISIVCPAVKRCGVNLSVGYYNQHTDKEYLDTNKLFTTIEKVKLILKDNYAKGKIWELEGRIDWEKEEWMGRWQERIDIWKEDHCFADGDDPRFNDNDYTECPYCGELMFCEDLVSTQGYCTMCGHFILTEDGVMVEG